MPQMAPLMWMILFFLFIFIFMMFNMLNYFNFYLLNTSESFKINKKNEALSWKW